METGIKNLLGQPAQPLGLAGNPNMEESCVATAYHAGINYFFFYNLSFELMIAGLKPILQHNRQEIIVATGCESRTPSALRDYLFEVRDRLNLDVIDVFYAEYVAPGDDMEALFGEEGVFDELHKWKAQGLIRYVGATAHNRPLAVKLIESGRVEVLMHRYNMAHRRSEAQVLPTAVAAGIPVVAFTSTRWGSLLAGHRDWDGPMPSAADCYRYVLHHPAVHLALTAPRTVSELKENLAALEGPESDNERLSLWESYGKLVYGDGSDAFEIRWP